MVDSVSNTVAVLKPAVYNRESWLWQPGDWASFWSPDHLKRSTDLVNGAFDTDVDTLTPASAAATMTDTNPPAGAAFYKVTD